MMIAEHRGSIACLGMVVVIAAGCARPAQGPTKAPEGAPGVATPAAQDVADAESDAHSLQSKVTRVTVYSDRARVTRQATAQVPGEPTVFAFRSLPGWVDDGSVQVSASAGRIVDVRVDRRFLAKATDASWRRVESEHKALADKLAALKDELAVLDAQKQQIEAIKAFSLAKITQDTLIVAELLRAMGYVDVVQRGGPLDGGVDVVARRVDAWGHRAEIAVQAKRYSAPVGRRFVDELLGAFRRQHFAEALLVTTSEFSAHALQAAHGEPNLKLVDGPRFVDMLAAHGVLLQVGKFGELKRHPTRTP